MKVAICTPCYRDVTGEYAGSLANMLLYTSEPRIIFNGEATAPRFQIFISSSSLLPQLRNMLAADAVECGANYLLWIDADHWFPPHSLLRLLSLNRPVVGANYPTRHAPVRPTALSLAGEPVWTTEEQAARGEVEQVSHVGLGFCLIDMNVIHALRSQQPEGQRDPLFALQSVGERNVLGEDVYFFRRVAEAGFGIYVDHALSWDVRHVAKRYLSSADALAQKGDFEAREAGLSE